MPDDPSELIEGEHIDPVEAFVPSLPAKRGNAPGDWELLAERMLGVSHPIRLKIIHVLRDGKERSPKSIAAEMGMPLGVLSYHMREMRKRKVIRLSRVEPARGALTHFYLLTDAGHEVREALRL